MKISKFFSALFGLIGILAAISAIWLSFYAVDAEPALIAMPESAVEQVESMMDSFCAGDYAAASGYLYGAPDLGVDREASDAVGVMIWEAFQESMTYELVGEAYATDTGLAQDILVTTLDISAVTAYLTAHTQENLEHQALAAEDYDTIFDENDEYREEFIQQVLAETTAQALENTDAQVTTAVTLNLVWSGDRWWVVSNDALLNAVSGGVAK